MIENISLNNIYTAVQEYKKQCKKNGYNPEFITYRFKGNELIEYD